MSTQPAEQADPHPVDEPEPLAPVARWRCCDCGATGLTSVGDTCALCEGLGHST